MPCNYKKYPANWKQIRAQILERAGHECEWCGVRDRSIGFRENGVFVELAQSKSSAGMECENAALDGHKVIEIVLTIAHLGTPHADGTPGDKRDKMDVRPENLAALCQRCHLVFDADEHAQNASITRAKKLRAVARDAGQLELSLVT